jgi:hypothetical protein
LRFEECARDVNFSPSLNINRIKNREWLSGDEKPDFIGDIEFEAILCYFRYASQSLHLNGLLYPDESYVINSINPKLEISEKEYFNLQEVSRFALISLEISEGRRSITLRSRS